MLYTIGVKFLQGFNTNKTYHFAAKNYHVVGDEVSVRSGNNPRPQAAKVVSCGIGVGKGVQKFKSGGPVEDHHRESSDKVSVKEFVNAVRTIQAVQGRDDMFYLTICSGGYINYNCDGRQLHGMSVNNLDSVKELLGIEPPKTPEQLEKEAIVAEMAKLKERLDKLEV